MRSRERVVAIELPTREADQMRRIQTCVLGIDRHKHLNDVVFWHTVENDRRHREVVIPDVVDVGV